MTMELISPDEEIVDGEIIDENDIEHMTEEQVRARMERDRVTLFTNGLRRLADFLDDHSELCPADTSSFTCNRWVMSSKNEILATLLRAVGAGEKVFDDNKIGIRRKFGPHTLGVYDWRSSTCEKKVVGTKDVTKVVESRADVPKTARNVKAVTETVTTYVYEDTEEETEWECPPSLLADSPKATPELDAF